MENQEILRQNIINDLKSLDELELPNGAEGAVWLEDVLKIINKHMSKRVASDHIESLQTGEVFVFGSNTSGYHGGGAARLAKDKWGAIEGQAEGLQGQCYGIPTMNHNASKTLVIDEIRPYVDRFIKFAKENQDKTFLVTEIGCGIAGLKPEKVAPLFKDAEDVENIHLPQSFWDNL